MASPTKTIYKKRNIAKKLKRFGDEDDVLHEIKGDLFTAPESASLGHCVSVDLVMGKGIAPRFKKLFGGLADLRSQGKQIGDVAILQRGSRYVYYMITKEKYWNKPTYESISNSIRAMRDHAVLNEVTDLRLPRIGCGLDGLAWRKVRNIIRNTFNGTGVRVIVYEFQGPSCPEVASV